MPVRIVPMDDWGGIDRESKTEVYILDLSTGEKGYRRSAVIGEYSEEKLRELGYMEVYKEDGIPVLIRIGP